MKRASTKSKTGHVDSANAEMTANKQGDDFELYVQSLYEGLGFVVERNVRILGQQIDLFLRKSLQGVGQVSYVVECKYIGKGKLGNQPVHDFVSFINNALRSERLNGGVLVCNTDFTLDAKDAASNSQFVQLKRQVDLERELFDVSDALYLYVRAFEKKSDFRKFVSLAGRCSRRTGGEQKIDDVLVYLAQWVGTATGGLCTVLGDFGSGKTTLLERLNYDLAKFLLTSAAPARLPIFFSLRDRHRFTTLEDFVMATLKRHFDTRIPSSIFWSQLRAGRFAILLDGFDEISTRVSPEERASLLLGLAPLLNTKSPAVMTCRPAYFVSNKEFTGLMIQLEAGSRRRMVAKLKGLDISDEMTAKYTEKPDYIALTKISSQNIDLLKFDGDKIDEYLSKRASEFSLDWLDIKKFLLSIYDLSDLMSRPILLSMIADTVIEGKIDVANETSIAGPTGLYEMYTSLQFTRDTFKHEVQTFLTAEQRRYFAHATALAMLESETLAVTYEQVISIVRSGVRDARRVGLPMGATEQQIATDIFVCSFLTRTSEDRFRFVHKSFMEFFIAQFVKINMDAAFDDSNVSKALRLLNYRLSNEILIFLAGYSRIDDRMAQKIELIISRASKDDNLERLPLHNANALLLYMAETQPGLTMMFGSFDDVSFKKVKWNSLQFLTCMFNIADLNSVAMTACRFEACFLSGASLFACGWENCLIENCEFDEVRLIKNKFNKVTMSGLLDGTRFFESTIENSIFGLRGGVDFSRCKVSDCIVDSTGDLNILFSECIVQQTVIVGANAFGSMDQRVTSITVFQARSSNFHSCFIFDVWAFDELTVEALRAAAQAGMRGLVHVNLSDIKGGKYAMTGSGYIEVVAARLAIVFHGIEAMKPKTVLSKLGELSPTVFNRSKKFNNITEAEVLESYMKKLESKNFGFARKSEFR